MDTFHAKLQNIKGEISRANNLTDEIYAHLFGDYTVKTERLTPTAPAQVYSSGLIPESNDRVNELSAMIDNLNSRLESLRDILNSTRNVDGGPACAVSR